MYLWGEMTYQIDGTGVLNRCLVQKLNNKIFEVVDFCRVYMYDLIVMLEIPQFFLTIFKLFNRTLEYIQYFIIFVSIKK